jgi:hypothetical protein
MRYIQKRNEPPASIRKWCELQEPVGVNLDYRSYTRKPELRAELIAEQFGLCAYTGTPLDEVLTREEIEHRIAVLARPVAGRLPEFSFCIRNYAQALLG